ncbi:MAG: 6-carboxytetrahydropterin synthase [Candidatus Sumerlaeota bacterium]|nr:6-carboxytetrahydropterin synthase [Candidatus Sumerlaeota bacterium]
MYRVLKRLEISAAHQLHLPYSSPCAQVHGHNWIVEVVCESETLDAQGMVVDFDHITRIVKQYDHKLLNDLLPQPTAENLARAICEAIPHCAQVTVQESEGSVAIYRLKG